MITNSIETAQRRVEAQHFDSRKNLLEYDDVMNQQRKSIYRLRRFILEADEAELREHALDAIEDVVVALVDQYCNEKERPDRWQVEGSKEDFQRQFGAEVDLSTVPRARNQYQSLLYFAAEKPYKAKIQEVNETQRGVDDPARKAIFPSTNRPTLERPFNDDGPTSYRHWSPRIRSARSKEGIPKKKASGSSVAWYLK